MADEVYEKRVPYSEMTYGFDTTCPNCEAHFHGRWTEDLDGMKKEGVSIKCPYCKTIYPVSEENSKQANP